MNVQLFKKYLFVGEGLDPPGHPEDAIAQLGNQNILPNGQMAVVMLRITGRVENPPLQMVRYNIMQRRIEKYAYMRMMRMDEKQASVSGSLSGLFC